MATRDFLQYVSTVCESFPVFGHCYGLGQHKIILTKLSDFDQNSNNTLHLSFIIYVQRNGSTKKFCVYPFMINKKQN